MAPHTAVRYRTFESNSSGTHALVISPSSDLSDTPLLLPAEVLEAGHWVIPKDTLVQFDNYYKRWRLFENKVAYLCWYFKLKINATPPAPNTWAARLVAAVHYLTGCTLQTDPDWTPSTGDMDIERFTVYAPSSDNFDAFWAPAHGQASECPQCSDSLLQFLRSSQHYVQTGYSCSTSSVYVETDATRSAPNAPWTATPGLEPAIGSTQQHTPEEWQTITFAFSSELPVLIAQNKILHNVQDRKLLREAFRQGLVYAINMFDYSPMSFGQTRPYRPSSLDGVTADNLTSAIYSTGLLSALDAYPSAHDTPEQLTLQLMNVVDNPSLPISLSPGWESRSSWEAILTLQDWFEHKGLGACSSFDTICYLHLVVPPHVHAQLMAVLDHRPEWQNQFVPYAIRGLKRTLEQWSHLKDKNSAAILEQLATLAPQA